MPGLVSKPVKRQTLAEQMANTIKDLILSNELKAGDGLPTEPELAKQFGVSRAVVRDATRILMAWGLVDAQHGRGVFVTETQNEAFGEALLLALRRNGATVWDVEQFEQVILPGVVALATQVATDEELDNIRRLADDYITIFREHQMKWWGRDDTPEQALEELRRAYDETLWQALLAATHNRVFEQLAQPLRRLRNLRDWAEAEGETVEDAIEKEASFVNRLVEALTSRNAEQARLTVAQLMQLPAEAVEAMRQTPVGEIPKIPRSLNR